jgi:hypothetical protein
LKTLVEGRIFDYNGNYRGYWDFPPNVRVSANYAIYGFRNGTFFLITQDDEYNWNVLSTVMPFFIGDGGKK